MAKQYATQSFQNLISQFRFYTFIKALHEYTVFLNMVSAVLRTQSTPLKIVLSHDRAYF